MEIDPPYNTGNDFVYEDDFKDNIKNYFEQTGQIDEKGNKLKTNTETTGRYHTNWLNMMYVRLKLAKNLMSDEGVILISIDDNEQHNLRTIGDEIFGEYNFYGTIVQLKKNTQNDSDEIQKNHEYIHVYTKNKKPLLLTYNNAVKKRVFDEKYYLGRDTGASSGHDKLVQRPKLGYTIYYFESTQNGATGNNNKLVQRIKLINKKYGEFNHFESDNKIIHAVAIRDYDESKVFENALEKDVYKTNTELVDFGYIPIRPPIRKGGKLGCWTWGLNTFKKYWNNNEVLIKNNKNVIKKEFVDPKNIIEENNKKFYIKNNTLPRKSILDVPNSEGTKELKGHKGLMPGVNFDNPKSSRMIKTLIKNYKKKNALVLDFFSGSATTAHAVMQANTEDNGKRKFILVQLPETIEKSEFNNICEIGQERIRRAGDKIISENPELKSKLDIGFKVLELDSSNIKKWNPETKDLQSQLFDMTENFVKGRTNEDVVYEVLLKYGLDLNTPINKKEISGTDIYDVDLGNLYIALGDNISIGAAEYIASKQKEYNNENPSAVFNDNGFKTDEIKLNIIEILKNNNFNEEQIMSI